MPKKPDEISKMFAEEARRERRAFTRSKARMIAMFQTICERLDNGDWPAGTENMAAHDVCSDIADDLREVGFNVRTRVMRAGERGRTRPPGSQSRACGW